MASSWKFEKNDDKFATVVGDYPVEGVTLVLADGSYTGDIVNSDPERGLKVLLENATLVGSVEGGTVEPDANSTWQSE